jgi:hypothetical protein
MIFRWGYLLVILTLCSCTTEKEDAAREAVVKEIRHPNGLLLTLRQNLSVDQTTDGFRVTPLGARELRAPFEIAVSLASGQRPPGEWPKSRRIKEMTVHYRIDSYPAGGSGGSVRILSAWRAHPNGYVLLTHQVQSEEPSESDFTLGWAVIADLRVQ